MLTKEVKDFSNIMCPLKRFENESKLINVGGKE